MKKSDEFQRPESNKLDQIVDQVNAEISAVYLPGTRKWVSEKRPDLRDKLLKADDGVGTAWKQTLADTSQIKGFVAELRTYRQAYIEAIEEYAKTFPPIVTLPPEEEQWVQEGLEQLRKQVAEQKKKGHTEV